VIDRIRRTLVLLSTFPRLGHAGIVHGTYEISIPRVPFLVVYRVDVGDRNEELIILRVYHAAQDRYDAFERCDRSRPGRDAARGSLRSMRAR